MSHFCCCFHLIEEDSLYTCTDYPAPVFILSKLLLLLRTFIMPQMNSLLFNLSFLWEVDLQDFLSSPRPRDGILSNLILINPWQKSWVR